MENVKEKKLFGNIIMIKGAEIGLSLLDKILIYYMVVLFWSINVK